MKKKKGDKIHGGFVALTYEIIDGRAFKKLNGAAMKAFILCLRKVRTFNPHDRYSYQFTLTYAEAQKSGLWASAFDRGIKELHKFGFIEIVHRGGMRFQGKSRTTYRLSQRYQKYGTAEFVERHEGHSEEVHGK